LSLWAERKRVVHGVLGKKCAVCGVYDHRGMNVDHIDAEKNPVRSNGEWKQNGHCGWQSGLSNAYDRLMQGEDITQSFQLLCGFHHTIKTYEERRAIPGQLEMFHEDTKPSRFIPFMGYIG
jgi:hypothetical protein